MDAKNSTDDFCSIVCDLDCHLGVKKRGKAGNGSLRDQRAMGALAVNLD